MYRTPFNVFIKSQEQFGYGNWKAVAEAVGSRNALQCKNHARHLVNSAKVSQSIKRTHILDYYD
jgi:protein MYSM1